ncbi:MAG: hypothetical protein RQ982_06900 [Gammaproteobacteria bacterium]|nr:hypothetical protein [Gammaproteobacteria bacterium]
MDKQYAEDFRSLLQVTMSGYDNEKSVLPRDVLAWWWRALEQCSFQHVMDAMTIHARRSKFKPRPADIIEIINQQDGRPTADEAWPIALQASDEMATAVWTSEIEQAWFHCYPVFDAGDEVGARMAFRQYYDRLVEHARMSGIQATWKISLGHDQTQRVSALAIAEQKGLITRDRVESLLPSSEPSGDGQHIAALLGSDKKPEQALSKQAQDYIEQIRAELAKPYSKPDLAAKRTQVEQQRRRELACQEKILKQGVNIA